MRRRDFITLLGGAAAAWPLAARAQQPSPMRRVGVLISGIEDEQRRLRVSAFQQELAKLGWSDGRNIAIDYRWGAFDTERMRQLAAELVGRRPDVLLAGGTPELSALQQATGSTPIVFAMVTDPIGSGFVASLARPGGNITGFIPVEPPLAGKWLELLKAMVPRLRRAALLFNPEVDTYAGEFFRNGQTAATALSVELVAAAVHDDTEIESVTAALVPDGGFIVMPEAFNGVHRGRIIAATAKLRVPAIYPYRFQAVEGGLISYGTDDAGLYRRAASYVDRILRGERAADLPVQAATRFELVINLKTAKALGIDVSQDVLSIADEVIE
jgi:putative ABC transport system substrate-binding protein